MKKKYNWYDDSLSYANEMLDNIINNKIQFTSIASRQSAINLYTTYKSYIQQKAVNEGLPIQLTLFN